MGRLVLTLLVGLLGPSAAPWCSVGIVPLGDAPEALRSAAPLRRLLNATAFGGRVVQSPAVRCPCAPSDLAAPCLWLCALRSLWTHRPAAWYALLAGDTFLSVRNLRRALDPLDPRQLWYATDFSSALRSDSAPRPRPDDSAPSACGFVLSHAAAERLLAAEASEPNGHPTLSALFRWAVESLGLRAHHAPGFYCGRPLVPSPPAACPPLPPPGPGCPVGRPRAVAWPAVFRLPAEDPDPRPLHRWLASHGGNVTLRCGDRSCLLCVGTSPPGLSADGPRTCDVYAPPTMPRLSVAHTLLYATPGPRLVPARVWEVLFFTQEVDLLQLRLYETHALVDVFVIVESTTTFQGDNRTLVFPLWRHHPRFAPYADKIRHVVVPLPANCRRDPWACEHHQRRAALRGLPIGPADVVLVTDADEVVSYEAMWTLRHCHLAFPVAIEVQFLYYSLRWTSADFRWRVPAFRGRDIHHLGPRRLRATDRRRTFLRNGGWHLSYFGGVPAIRAKLLAFSHTELRNHSDPDHLRRSIQTGTDLFGRPDHRWVPWAQTPLPRLVTDRPCDFPVLFDATAARDDAVG